MNKQEAKKYVRQHLAREIRARLEYKSDWRWLLGVELYGDFPEGVFNFEDQSLVTQELAIVAAKLEAESGGKIDSVGRKVNERKITARP